MERHRSDTRDHFVSSYLQQTTGRITTIPPFDLGLQGALSLVDEAAENVFGQAKDSSVHCYRDRRTGEVASMITRTHNYGGGFAVTKRQKVLRGQEDDGKSAFDHTILSRAHLGVEHVFRLRANAPPRTGYPPASTAGNMNDALEVDHPMIPQQDQGEIDPTPTIAHAVPRVPRTHTEREQQKKEKEPKLSDESLLAQTVELQRRKLVTLSREPEDNPHIRVHHIYRKGRTFAYATAFLKSERGPKAILSVLWETRTKPHRAVTVTFSLPESSGSLTAHCSCDYLTTQTKGSQPNCYHAQTLFNNQDFIDQVRREIRRRQDVPRLDPSSTFFGDAIDLATIKDSSPYLTAFLQRQPSKQRNITKPWMFFMVLDIRLQLFVPVVKMKQKALQCLGCRMSSIMGGNCCHVEGCISACKKLQSSGVGDEFLADLGLIYNCHDSDRDTTFGDEDEPSEDELENDEDDIRPNRSITVPEIYYPTTFKRPIMPCPGELEMMRNIAMEIDHVPPGEVLSLDDRNTVPCHKCGTENTKPRYGGYSREVTLFTLAQGAPTIHVYDWYCDTCHEKRNFTGKAWGVFPAFRKSCYTTELMYLVLEMTCLHALSFRTAYRITRLLARAPSIAMRLGKLHISDLGDTSNRSRRRMNDAFGAFVDHLDTINAVVTNKLFSCDTCEVSLSKDDCDDLGISPGNAKDMKRLKAVVIDGTAAGILTKLPEFDRHTAIVPPAPGGFGSIHLIRDKTHRKALTKLFDIWRTSLRSWSKKASSPVSPSAHSLDADYVKFWIRNPTRATQNGIVCSKPLMNEQESQITQLFMNHEACFCPLDTPQRSLADEHWDRCEKIRKEFNESEQSIRAVKAIRTIFKQLLAITQYVVPDPMTQMVQDGQGSDSMTGGIDAEQRRDEEQEDDDGSEQEQVSHGTVSGAWLKLLLPNATTNPQFVESIIAVLRFLLLEHIALPYVGRLSIRPEITWPARRENGQEHEVADEEQRDEEQQQNEERDDENRQDENQGNEDLQDEDQQDEDQQDHRDDDDDNESSSEEEEELPPMLSFTKGAMKLHEKLIGTMEVYVSCMHFRENGRVQSLPQECSCVQNFKRATVAVNEASPVLGTFCQEFLKVGRPLSISHSSFAISLLDVLKRHMKEAKKFFVNLKHSLPEESEEYWEQYGKSENSTIRGLPVQGHVGQAPNTRGADRSSGQANTSGQLPQQDSDGQVEPHSSNASGTVRGEDNNASQAENAHNNSGTAEPAGDETQATNNQEQGQETAESFASAELEESKETGMCFPGRRSCRPSIMFHGKDKPNCAKYYKVSRSHTPGLLTVQCGCDSPKLLGFIIMTQAESTALALSALLTHFGVPPRSIFYDNACNLFTSILIRVPWLLGKTRLAVDRFHYKSHKCCAYFNPDSYRHFDMQRTETAESINARIEKGLKTIRYIKGENLIQFLRARFSLLNLTACFRQIYSRTDIEDEDLTSFFHKIVPCDCDRCQDLKKASDAKQQRDGENEESREGREDEEDEEDEEGREDEEGGEEQEGGEDEKDESDIEDGGE